MKQLFLSDLHLGNPFFESADLRAITKLLGNYYDEIYFLGDIFDSWEMYLDEIMIKYNRLVDLIDNVSTICSVTIVQGNHDPSIDKYVTIFPYCTVSTKVVKPNFVAIHGHQFDSELIKYSRLVRFLYPIQKIFEKFGLSPNYFFRELFHSIALKRNKSYHNSLVLDIEKAACDYFKRRVIMGHTHIPKLVPGKYINCGDWTHNKSYVECIDGKFKLINLRKNSILTEED